MKYILFVILVISSINVYSQEIRVDSFFCDDKDLTANRISSEVLDQNGDKCALLRIQTVHKGFVFDVGSAGIQAVDDNRAGEIWLWVPYGIKHISIRHQLLGNLINYNFPVAIQKARVYIMKLSNDNQIQYDDGKIKRVSFVIHPADSKFRLNGISIQLVGGRTEIEIPYGKHQMRVVRENYELMDSVIIVDDNSSIYNISLKPIFSTLKIESIPTSSIVYIDGVQRGVTPIELDEVIIGRHLIELTNSDEYSTYIDSLNILKDETSYINIALNKKLNACLELDGFETNMKVYLDGSIMKVVKNKLQIKTDKGDHQLLIKRNNIDCYSKTFTLSKEEEIFRFNLNNLKTKASDVIVYNSNINLYSHTYVGTIESSYNGYTAFPKMNESARARCIKRLQKKAAKRGCSIIKMITESPRPFFIRITAEMYK